MPDDDIIAAIFQEVEALEEQVRKIRSAERQKTILERLEKLRKDLEELVIRMRTK